MTLSAVLISLATVLLAAQPLAAQQPVDQADAVRAFARTLQPGNVVSVRMKDGHVEKGRVVQVSADGLQVLPRTRVPVPARTLPLSEIASIERAGPGMSAGKKFVIWAGVGAGVFLVGLLSLIANSQ